MLTLLIGLSTAAFAGACHWEGEADDPFTHQDGRYLSSELPLKGRRSWAALDVHHAAGDVVRIDLGFSEGGASVRLVDATIQLLLDDASVIELRVVESTPPIQRLNPYFQTAWGSMGVDTRHVAVGQLTVAEARAIASSTITSIRHDLFGAGVITFDVASSASRKFASALACAIGP